ncbi:MAG: hypothetical protein KatS3mg028_0801 [Bacteroidia bacterium]|nr:MAG: hypothetical protein KatS3mg028_0801 [Bacteroidia bacterium]
MCVPPKVTKTKYTLSGLREIQDWIIRRQLLGTKGVADVSSFGGKLKQYEISINPYQLNARQLTIQDILNALEQNNQNVGSAYIEKQSTAYFIRTEGLVSSVKDIENIVVKTIRLRHVPIQIKDVATVKISAAPRYGATGIYLPECLHTIRNRRRNSNDAQRRKQQRSNRTSEKSKLPKYKKIYPKASS